MPMSLLDKATNVFKSQLHELLDRKVNTPEGFKQLIRNLEVAQADLRAGRDEAAGTANGYRRTITEWQGEIADKQGDIDLMLADDDPTNDQAALQLQLDVQALENLVAENTALLSDQLQQIDQLDGALNQLEVKHQKMVTDYRKLTQTAAATTAKNRAAEAIENAADAASSMGSIDNIQAELNHRNDVASARFDRVMGEMSSTQSPEAAADLARAKAALDQRRKELAEAAVATTQTEEPTSP